MWSVCPLLMGLLGDQPLCAKILVVIKGFLSGRLCVSLYSGTTWKDDSEFPYLEMRETQDKGQNDFRSCDQEGIILVGGWMRV